MGSICAICGKPWDDCCGECQDDISLKEKVEFLRAMADLKVKQINQDEPRKE